jgi:4-hydroxybenzoate polyprenyltransferase
MIEEYHGKSLYRLEYISALLVPILIALLEANLFSFKIIIPIIGWILLAVGMNLMNDAIDCDRRLNFSRRSLLYLSLVATVLGLWITFFYNFLYALGFIFLISFYNLKLKKIPFLNLVILVAGYMILGYLAFAKNPQILTLLVLFFAGLASQLIHDVADQDATSRYLKNRAVNLTIIANLFFFLITLYVAIKIGSFWLPAPLISGIALYEIIRCRNKLEKWPEIKETSTEAFKFAVIYLFVFMIK